MNRRNFIKGSGAILTLPSFGSSISKKVCNTRLVAFVNHLGFYEKEFFPSKSGTIRSLPTLLKPLDPFKSKMTIVKGIKGGGHGGTNNALSGSLNAQKFEAPSIDQYLAHNLKSQFLYPVLNLRGCSQDGGAQGGSQYIWGMKGERIVEEHNTEFLYNKLFNKISEEEYLKNKNIIQDMKKEAFGLSKAFSSDPQNKFEEYIQSIKKLELDLERKYRHTNKHKIKIDRPKNYEYHSELISNIDTQCEFIYYSFLNNLTNICTISVPFVNSAIRIKGKMTSQGYHKLSHHGLVPSKIEELLVLERTQIESIAKLVTKLEKTPEGSGTMLDNTLVLIIGGMSDANKHRTANRPICMVGGRLKHKGLVNANGRNHSDLLVSIINSFGLPDTKYAYSSRNFNELVL